MFVDEIFYYIHKQAVYTVWSLPPLPAISTFTTQLYWKLKRNVYVTWSNCTIFWPDPLAFYLGCTFTWKLHGSRDRMDCLHVCSFAYVWVLSHGYNRILKTMVNVTCLGECCIFQWQMLSFFYCGTAIDFLVIWPKNCPAVKNRSAIEKRKIHHWKCNIHHVFMTRLKQWLKFKHRSRDSWLFTRLWCNVIVVVE